MTAFIIGGGVLIVFLLGVLAGIKLREMVDDYRSAVLEDWSGM